MGSPNAGSGAAAYDRLRRAIVHVELAPGTAVSEAQLVDAFGFSKAAVRAALARLRAEGLVVAMPRRGHVVSPVTMRDVLEIYDLRLLLEPPAAEAAAGAIEPARIAQLRALVEPAVDFDDPASLERFLAANRAIHLAVADASGNRRAAQLVERLLDDSERARLVALRAGAASHGERARSELIGVLDALEARDGAAAALLMAAAIRGFRDELVDSLRESALDVPLGTT